MDKVIAEMVTANVLKLSSATDVSLGVGYKLKYKLCNNTFNNNLSILWNDCYNQFMHNLNHLVIATK